MQSQSPRVSNDNPFSESQFKTLKYQPDYLGRFPDVSHARRWCEGYFDWYNFEHHHSGLAGFTPEQVFTERYRDVAVQKQRILDERYERHPERFVRGRPMVPLPRRQSASTRWRWPLMTPWMPIGLTSGR